MGDNVRLDDELDRNAFLFTQSDKSVEGLFPGRVPGEAVVGEEVEINRRSPGTPVELSSLCTPETGSGSCGPER